MATARVICPDGLSLDATETDLLQQAFPDRDRVHVRRQFGGGMSGNRVLQVQSFGQDGRGYLPQVVKIGSADDIASEKDNYELFRDRLEQATAVSRIAVEGVRAAIVYADAGAAAALDRVVTFGEYFQTHDQDDLHAALYAVLHSGLGRVYGSYSVGHWTHRQSVGLWLPENLVVSLAGNEGDFGVYDPDIAPTVAGASTLGPSDVEGRDRVNLEPGSVVLLRGFRIGKLQAADLNLEDEDQQAYRVKVRFDGATPEGLATGDRVDVVARVVTDRWTRLGFALDHCLARHGLDRHARGFDASCGVFPTPLDFLSEVLDRNCDSALATIHGDLHWENVMLEGPQNWRLIDYGLVRERGPVLFDFVKLEVFLRAMGLGAAPDVEPSAMLELELDLLDDPFGHFPDRANRPAALSKAADAIRTIRRLARRYMVDGYEGYLATLFCYSVATTKYYPTTDRWAAAESRPEEIDRLNRQSRFVFFAVAPALAAARYFASTAGASQIPTLKFDFLPAGSKVNPMPGAVVLDTGNGLEPGVIDHHQLSGGTAHCTTTLVLDRPELVTDHLDALDATEAVWTVHKHPDFDCFAATYLAWHRAALGFFPPGAAQLGGYARRVDEGAAFLDDVDDPARTPYGLLALRLAGIDPTDESDEAEAERMRRGLDVVRTFCHWEATGTHALAANQCPREHGLWQVRRTDDERVFETHDLRLAAAETRAEVVVDGHPRSLNLLALRSPRSLFFKTWARRAGHELLVVLWTQAREPDDMIIVSVPPRYGGALAGLGRRLEKLETKRREQMPGKERYPPHRFEETYSECSDPWYDGRSPAHNYTIVAAPHVGTVLSLDEVVEVVVSGSWR